MTKFETNLSGVIEELQNKEVAQDAKDVDLQNQIDSEIANRTNADDQLQTNINVEANARAAADQDLQKQIDFVMKYLVPVGVIDYFARASSPEGWLKADEFQEVNMLICLQQ